MRTDVALDVHYKTISGVKLFHGCDPGLLKSLIIRLRPILFLPGLFIINFPVFCPTYYLFMSNMFLEMNFSQLMNLI